MSDYLAFLERKTHLGSEDGFEPLWMPDSLFDFQAALTEWSLRLGRGAVFADCGLGKTLMQLVWATNVAKHAGRPVLVLTPLAVAQQTIREADKFGMEAVRSSRGEVEAQVVVTNYERLHLFDSERFAGVVCDESSILKSFDGKRRAEITEFMRKVPYRLLCTATAAPNDYTELGTSSEALGGLGHVDMLGRFFRNDQNTVKPMVYRHRGQDFAKLEERSKWRLKGHAEEPFWRWVASWARACRKPSDLGFSDEGFDLPELIENEHVVQSRQAAPGRLFDVTAVGLQEQREERRRTIEERCEYVAGLVADTGKPAVVWCHLNDEGTRLAGLIDDAVEVSGKDSDDAKEEKFQAFGAGEARVLITKPKIGAWGLNWQHCNHLTFFPSHSYEQYYQAVRRCWRFGQTKPVLVDVVATEGEVGVKKNLQRKSAAADRMFSSLVAHMTDAMKLDAASYGDLTAEVPSWL